MKERDEHQAGGFRERVLVVDDTPANLLALRAILEPLGQVEFATNRDVILDASMSLMEEIRAALAANPQIQVRIEGHTDDRGQARRNLDLSRRRAQSVRVWLVAHGIAAERLLASGCGRAIPIASNKSSNGRQRNRRVELRIVDTGDSRQGLREGCIDATVASRPEAAATPTR